MRIDLAFESQITDLRSFRHSKKDASHRNCSDPKRQSGLARYLRVLNYSKKFYHHVETLENKGKGFNNGFVSQIALIRSQSLISLLP